MIEEFLHENTWIKLQAEGDIPCPRTGHCACSFKNECMYIFGGYSDEKALNDMYKYNIISKIWEKIDYQNSISEIPSGRASAQLCAYSEMGKIYLFGGTGMEVNEHSTNDLYEFDVNQKTWRIIETGKYVPCERYGHSMTLHNNFLILFGGARIVKQGNKLVSEYLNDLWMLSLLDKNWRKITPGGTLPSPRYRQEIIVHNNGLYLIGGGTTNERFSSIFKYEFSQNQWTQVNLANQNANNKKDLLFKGRMGHICILDNEEILLYGGVDDAVNTDPLSYSIDKRMWRKIFIKGYLFIFQMLKICQKVQYSFQSKHPKPREFFSGCKFHHSIIIFGGRVGQKKVNDLYIWNISCPTPTKKHCTLKSEMLQLFYTQENQGDWVITCKKDNKSISAHSYIIRHRSNKFYESLKQQNLYFDGCSKLLSHILHFIYSGEVNFTKINPEIITDLIEFSICSEMKYFFRIIILNCLVTSANQQEINILDGILRSLQNKCNEAQSPFLKSLLNWMDLRRNIKSYQPSQSTPTSRNQNRRESDINGEIFKSLNSFQQSFDSVFNLNTVLYYSDFNQLKLDTDTSNFYLVYENKQYKLHTAILSARCGYFESYFNVHSLLPQQNEMVIQPFLIHSNTQLLDFFIFYLYNGMEAFTKFKLTTENLINLLDITNYFMVKSPTFNYLIENAIFNEGITLENCLKTMQFAEQFNAIFLRSKVLSFMVQNMSKVLKLYEKDLLAMNPKFLVEMIRMQNDQIISNYQ
ncbi:hypothetical protein ABPG74_018862 [Tetrahymena malaccensis]